MLVLLVSLLLIVTAGGLVVAYVAFPQRGRAIPRAGWLSQAMQRAVDRVGIDPDDDEAARGGHLAGRRPRAED